MADFRLRDTHYITIIVKFRKLLIQLDQKYVALSKIFDILHKAGVDSEPVWEEMKKITKQRGKLAELLNSEGKDLAKEITGNVVTRYFSYKKINQRPVGVTGDLGRALQDETNNIQVTSLFGQMVVQVIPKEGLPFYHVYQEHLRSRATDFKVKRAFILDRSSAAEEIYAKDKDIAKDKIKNVFLSVIGPDVIIKEKNG